MPEAKSKPAVVIRDLHSLDDLRKVETLSRSLPSDRECCPDHDRAIKKQAFGWGI